MIDKGSVISVLPELSAGEISEVTNPEEFEEHMSIARQGGNIATHARMELEQKTGKEEVNPLNAKSALQIDKNSNEQ